MMRWIAERNLRESFRLVKNDIIKLQAELAKISHTQEKIMEHVHYADSKREVLAQRIEQVNSKKPVKVVKATKKKVVDRPARKKYVGSTDTKVYHMTSARIAKLIKLKNRVYSDSPKYLQKLGMKPSRQLKLLIKKNHQKAAKKGKK